MHRRHLLRVSSLVLLTGLQWGCHTGLNTGAPTAEGQHQLPPPGPTLLPGEDAHSSTAYERQALLEQMDCHTLGAFALQLAHARDQLGLTKAEALSMVAQGRRQHLQTTATHDGVIATGRRLRFIVELVYRAPGWTPEELALQSRTLCLEHYAKPR